MRALYLVYKPRWESVNTQQTLRVQHCGAKCCLSPIFRPICRLFTSPLNGVLELCWSPACCCWSLRPLNVIYHENSPPLSQLRCTSPPALTHKNMLWAVCELQNSPIRPISLHLTQMDCCSYESSKELQRYLFPRLGSHCMMEMRAEYRFLLFVP